MGLPVGLHGTYVLPVSSEGIGVDALISRQHCRDNVATEIMLAGGIAVFIGARILDEYTSQHVAIKDVDAHRTQCATWLLRLLLKRDDASLGISFQNAK